MAAAMAMAGGEGGGGAAPPRGELAQLAEEFGAAWEHVRFFRTEAADLRTTVRSLSSQVEGLPEEVLSRQSGGGGSLLAAYQQTLKAAILVAADCRKKIIFPFTYFYSNQKSILRKIREINAQFAECEEALVRVRKEGGGAGPPVGAGACWSLLERALRATALVCSACSPVAPLTLAGGGEGEEEGEGGELNGRDVELFLEEQQLTEQEVEEWKEELTAIADEERRNGELRTAENMERILGRLRSRPVTAVNGFGSRSGLKGE